MSTLELYRDDLLNRFASHTFTEAAVDNLWTITFKDAGSVTIDEVTKQGKEEAYILIRENLVGKSQDVPIQITTTQRDVLTSPATSTRIYNLTESRSESFDGTDWLNSAGSVIDSNAAINVSGTNAATTRIRTMRYQNTANSGAGIQAGHSRGSESSASALLSGDELAQYVFLGDNGTNQTSAGPVVRGKTTENWGSSAKGSLIEFAVIKNGETSETIGFTVEPSTTAGDTYMLVYDVDNATLERVTIGAVDSGGTGFKVLRIPN